MRPVYGRLTKAIGYGEVYIHGLLRLYIITTITDRDVFISFDKSKKLHMVIHAIFGVNILYFCDTLAFYYCKTVSLPYFANVNIFHFFLYYPVHMQCQLIICKP